MRTIPERFYINEPHNTHTMYWTRGSPIPWLTIYQCSTTTIQLASDMSRWLESFEQEITACGWMSELNRRRKRWVVYVVELQSHMRKHRLHVVGWTAILFCRCSLRHQSPRKCNVLSIWYILTRLPQRYAIITRNSLKVVELWWRLQHKCMWSQ